MNKTHYYKVDIFDKKSLLVNEDVLNKVHLFKRNTVVRNIVKKKKWAHYKGKVLPKWVIDIFYEKITVYKNKQKKDFYIHLKELPLFWNKAFPKHLYQNKI